MKLTMPSSGLSILEHLTEVAVELYSNQNKSTDFIFCLFESDLSYLIYKYYQDLEKEDQLNETKSEKFGNRIQADILHNQDERGELHNISIGAKTLMENILQEENEIKEEVDIQENPLFTEGEHKNKDINGRDNSEKKEDCKKAQNEEIIETKLEIEDDAMEDGEPINHYDNGDRDESLEGISSDQNNEKIATTKLDCPNLQAPNLASCSVLIKKLQKCNKCEKYFLTMNEVKGHSELCGIKRRKLGRKRQQDYFCIICSSKKMSYSQFNIHMRSHTGEKPFQCDICDKKFPLLGNLKRHQITHTGIRHSCDVCSKYFRRLESLELHKKTHTGDHGDTEEISEDLELRKNLSVQMEKGEMRSKKRQLDLVSLKCNICSKQVASYSQLIIHMRSHTGEKPFPCNVCKKRFSAEHNLNQHKKIHLGIRPYSCDICQKSYRQFSKLKTHKLTHTLIERGYSCDICETKFRLKKSLTLHLQLHNGVKPYFCYLCEEKFSCKSDLDQHKTFHLSSDVELPKIPEVNVEEIQSSKLFEKPHKIHLDSNLDTHLDKEEINNDVTIKQQDPDPLAVEDHEDKEVILKDLKFGKNPLPAQRQVGNKGRKRRQLDLDSLKCNVCSKQLRSSSQLIIHMRSHTGEKPYQCDICDRRFSTTSNLSNHKRYHTGIKPYSCDVCLKSFYLRTNLNIHMATHTGEKSFPCDICNKKFNQKTSLIVHTRRHTGEKPYSCDVCEEKLITKAALDKHRTFHSTSDVDLTKISDVNVEEIQSSKLIEKPHELHLDSNLDNHLDKEEINEDVTIKQESDPLAVDHGDKEVILKGFELGKNPLPAQRQVGKKRRKRRKLDLDNLKCNVCGKQHASSSQLIIHMRSHTGEKPYQCDVCDRRFSTKSNLHHHKKYHTGIKPHSCHVCLKSFYRIENLNVHMVTHTGEKAFSCDICNKKFTQKYSLTIHIRTHTGEKPYSCDLCEKKFPYKNALDHHKLLHSDVKPFSCVICGKRFRFEGSIKKHNIAFHPRSDLTDIPVPKITEKEEKSISIKNLKRVQLKKKLKSTTLKIDTSTNIEAFEDFAIAQDDSIGYIEERGAPDQDSETKKNFSLPQNEASRKKGTDEGNLNGKTFNQKSYLTEQTKNGTEEKTFSCDMCDESFSFSGALSQHKMVHVNAKPFSCDICGKCFAFKQSLEKHEKITHN